MSKTTIIDRKVFDILFCCIFNMGKESQMNLQIPGVREEIERSYMNMLEWEATEMVEQKNKLINYIESNPNVFDDSNIEIKLEYKPKTFIKK